jgi:hypothetical protein
VDVLKKYRGSNVGNAGPDVKGAQQLERGFKVEVFGQQLNV